MFFSIDDTIFNSFINGMYEKEINDVFKDLYNGFKRGNNIVSIDSNFFIIHQNNILNSELLSSDSKKLLYSCMDNQMYNDIIKDSISEFVTITLFEGDVCKLKMDDGKVNYQLNLLTLHSSGISLQNKVTLIGEDFSDCEFYEKFTNVYLNRTESPLKDLKISFKHSAGAGHNIRTTFNSSVKHNKEITFGIADSDKFYPNEIKNDCTAKYLETAFNELSEISYVGLFNYCILKVSEIENLISPKEYKNFHPNKSELDIFISIEDDPEYNHYLKFFDLKKGLSKKDWFKNQSYQEYYKPLITKYPDLLTIGDEALVNEDLCEEPYITLSGGRTILREVYLEDVNNIQPDYLCHEIIDFIEQLSSWGVGTGSETFGII